MTQHDKDLVLAKIDALRWSFADTQLQSIAGVLYDVASLINVDGKPELGFAAKQTMPNATINKEEKK